MIRGSSKPLSEKLQKYTIDPITNCWRWIGATDKDGYGVMRGSAYNVIWADKAHRKSYEHYVGPIPFGAHVLHTCDVPCCINPEHLYLGDPKQNGLDKKNRGRARGKIRYGSDNPMYGRTGASNPFFGKRHTEEAKEQMRQKRRAWWDAQR